MEKLIMKYTITDGYTYSYERDEPFLYANKPDAIDDLTLNLLDYIDRLAIHETEMEVLELHRSKILSGAKTNKKATEDYHVILQKMEESEKRLRSEITFGGAIINCANFIADDENGKKVVNLPVIITLDEFYAPIYAQIETKQKSKLKM